MSDSCGGEPFVLRVVGDSMMPEFSDGNVILIEPDGVVQNGSFVLALHNGEYIFRQLQIEDGKYYLKPLNAEYPTLEIADMTAVHGVITQGGGIRRSQRKRYA
jgi:SOS-response transcriptional repressor LexA